MANNSIRHKSFGATLQKGVNMKKGKLFSICLALSTLIAGFCFIFLPASDGNNIGNTNNSQVYASYTRGDSYSMSKNDSENYTYLGTSNIPYSLFTSYQATGAKDYQITDYYPEATVSADGYNYKMGETSAPYILLSSKTSESNPVLNKLYNTNLIFRFNPIDAKLDSKRNYATIPELYVNECTLTVKNSYVGKQELNASFTQTTNGDYGYEFKLNLQALTSDNTNAFCPTYLDGQTLKYLGGEIDNNNASHRTGLYTLTIQYNYRFDGTSVTSDKCKFVINFNVIDYSEYVSLDGSTPLTFQNASLYDPYSTTTSTGGTGNTNAKTLVKEYNLYNYNFDSAPIVKYDASKFALNFKYYVGGNENNCYEFTYDNDSFEEMSGNEEYTGRVTLKCDKLKDSQGNSKTYSFYTKKDNVNYYGYFDLKDFEDNFIMQNSASMLTSVFQGRYEFYLDILAPSSSTSGNKYIKVDQDLFQEDVTSNLSFQNLIIFGFDLKYTDSDGSNLSLINNVTHTNILSYNKVDSNKYFNVPSKIATTNLAPLKFHSYGNLETSDSTNIAKYMLFELSSTTEQDIISTLSNEQANQTPAEDLFAINFFKDKTQLDYTQLASFTSEGIYFIKLNYSLTLSVLVQSKEDDQVESTIESQKIEGTQYVLFEINNSAQELFIHAYEKDGTQEYAYTFNDYTNKNVRVAIEEKNNIFTSANSIVYSMSSTYDKTQLTTPTPLEYKLDNDGSRATYQVNGKTYNYFVLDQKNDYTFSKNQNGYYNVSVQRGEDYYPKYAFNIDSSKHSNVKISNALPTTNNSYVKGDELTPSSTTSDATYIENGLYITDGAFTLEWQEKLSGATSTLYVTYMKLQERAGMSDTLIRQGNSGSATAYWLTNNYGFTEIMPNSEPSYQNSFNKTNLSVTNYFNREGLYYFFLFDQSGNFTTRAVLIDKSIPTIAQGYWEETFENSTWKSNYNKNSLSNDVDSDTYLYFGTHKALSFSPSLSGTTITIEDYYPYINRYTIGTTEKISSSPITIDFDDDVLHKISCIQKNNGTKLFGDDVASTDYFLLIENDNYQASNITTGEKVSQNIDIDNYYTILHDEQMSSTQKFYGEASYIFTLTNFSNLTSSRKINMNFDKVKMYFYAYNQSDNPIYIAKNSGTNLKTLRLEYEYNSQDTTVADCYQIASLTYSYYPFVIDKSDSRYNSTTYPFSATAEQENIPLTSVSKSGSSNIFVVDAINVNYSTNATKPGKYVITRTYKGGNCKLTGKDGDGNLTYETVESGGAYYRASDTSEPVPLFDKDSLVKQYEIYVDSNSIFDESSNIGQNITLSLGSGANSWTFNDFIKMSSGLDKLVTNRTPVTINVPYSKYFINDNIYVASKYNFSKLNLQVSFTSKNGLTTTYLADGFNNKGFLTCSSLTNTNGEFVFSEEGQYTLTISDNAGYDYVSATKILYNQNPNQLTFSFTISNSTFTATGYSYLGNEQKGVFESTELESETGKNFSTNAQAISSVNEQNNKLNKIYLAFDDPSNPYLSKINKIDIKSLSRDKTLTITSFGELYTWATNGQVYAIDRNTYEYYVVNKSELATRDYLCYLEISFYDSNSQGETFDEKTYYRYSYKLYFTLLEEDTFEVTLSSESESATYTLSVDRTKPTTNLDTLIANETFLQNRYKDELSSFKDENVFSTSYTNLETAFYNMPNNLTYTFGVPKGYRLEYNSQETLSYFYIRSYNKYEGEYPSRTPDMSGTIYDDNFFRNYPQFSEVSLIGDVIHNGNAIWYKVNYSTTSTLYDQILTATQATPQGYYEIIEKDNAGNFRTFTIYYATSEPILELDGIDSENNTYESDFSENLTANVNFQITKLSSKLGWGVITIKNETLGVSYQKEILLVPDSDVLTANVKNAINQFMNDELAINSRFSFTLSKYNNYFTTVIRSVSIITNKSTAYLDAPTVKESKEISGKTIYKLEFPVYSQKSVLYLTKLEMQKYSEGAGWQQIPSLTFSTKEDIASNNPITITEEGIYKAIYHDNYNASAYEYNVYVGKYLINDFDLEYDFEYSYLQDPTTKKYYTGGSVDVTYEARIYSVVVTATYNSTTSSIAVNATDSKTIPNKNCKTFTLSSLVNSQDTTAKDSRGGTTTYTIDYIDVTGEIQKSITIVIYDRLPEILLTNGNDSNIEIGSTTFESTSQITNSIVKVNWGENTDCEFDTINGQDAITANLYVKSDKGTYTLKTSSLENGTLIVDEGYYKLELKNNLLGNARYVYFAIQFGDFPLYTVTSNNKEISPSQIEKLDLTENTTDDNTMLINVLYQSLLANKDNDALSQIVDRNKSAFEVILNAFGFVKNSDGTYVFSNDNVGIANITKLNHYYSIYDMEIIYNSNIDLDIVEFVFENNTFKDCFVNGSKGTTSYDSKKYITTIYLVFSLKSATTIKLFATTKVPTTTTLLSNNLYYGSNNNSINLSQNTTSKEITDSQYIENGQLKLSFNKLKSDTSYWYSKGNYIYCLEQFGMDSEYTTPTLTTNAIGSLNYVYLTGSGTHKLKFMDLAGNVHKFVNTSLGSEPDVYTLYIITKVVFYVNYNDTFSNPIEYAIYNDSVSLQVDEYYTQKDKFVYSISVMRNGQKYSNYDKAEDLFTFNEAGRYVVTFTSEYGTSKLENVVYNFTLLSTKSARLAYEFAGIPGYEIVKVVKNNVDITSNFQVDGKITSLFISSSDSRSGNGDYTITLKVGERDSDLLVYSFRINDYVPTISSNVKYGETTTGNIDISYNPSYIYNQLGKCYIVVYVYNSDSNAIYEFSRFTIDENETSSLSSFTLTRSYTYFVQVVTETGNTISSFRVNKTDPLNFFAIIIIIVSVVAGIVLTIVIVKLRTRMRVK